MDIFFTWVDFSLMTGSLGFTRRSIMCRKLMFLISLVCFLTISVPVSAECLVVCDVGPYVVSGVEEYDCIEVCGTLIVPSGATLIVNGRSRIDGNGNDGEGGTEHAQVIVDGGTFLLNDRLDMGTDHDAYLIIRNGGYLEHHGDKITIPDNDGGEHRLIIEDGEVVAEEIEVIVDRDAKIIVGCAGSLTMGNTDEDDSRDPTWLAANGGLECSAACLDGGGIMEIEDLGDNVKRVYCFIAGPEARDPSPRDGAINVRPSITMYGIELCWKAGTELGRGRHYLYEFVDALRNGPDGITCYNVGILPLWQTFYWKVDEFNEDGSLKPGPCWSFTTGCPTIVGDVNRDCVLNFLDFADIASTWQQEQFWPR
jgi:hypothetical protein